METSGIFDFKFYDCILIRLSKSVMHPTGTFLFVFGKRI